MGLTKQAKTLCKSQVALLFTMLKGIALSAAQSRHRPTSIKGALLQGYSD